MRIGRSIGAAAGLAWPLFVGAAQSAERLLATGHADQALAALTRQLAVNPNDAAALNLQCRVYFAEGQMEQAQPPCERAVAAAPDEALYHLWLGRVLGRKAEHAPALQAYGLAKKVHAEFEQAHKFAPRDREAAEDLAEYYVEAPRILGGGHAKAAALAGEVEPWAPGLAHGIRARIAEAEKKPADAEREFTLAAAAPDGGPAALVALASFQQNQGRVPEMLRTLDAVIAKDTAQDDALVSASELLTRASRRPEQAIALLRGYLASARQSENAPAFRVHAQLAKLLAAAGDEAGAHAELAAAHVLASGYTPESGRPGK